MVKNENGSQFPQINTNQCTGCGQCIPVCPYKTIGLHQNKAHVSGDQCFECGHCVAACPQEAILLDRLLPAMTFDTFSMKKNWIPYGEFDTGKLVQLIQSRRSCRSFTQQPVGLDSLQDLVKIGTTAPSGTNSQCWTFTIIPERIGVLELAMMIKGFFQKLNKLAQNKAVRVLSRIMGKKELTDYYTNHFVSVQNALAQWDDHQKDQLFHDAVSLIIIGSRAGASCPKEDALMASQNILISAHAMGLGTCMIGYAVEAINRDEKIREHLQMAKSENVHAVIALGYPNDQYHKTAQRKKYISRVLFRKT